MMLETLTPLVIAICAFGFFGGGVTKGAIGGGLPAVAVPVMATVLAPAEAIALTFVPVALANIWQALQGGHYREAFARYWPFTVLYGLGIAAGSQILVALDPDLMALVIGLFVILTSIAQGAARDFAISDRAGRWADPLGGTLLGVAAGATAMFAPLIVWFSARRPPKDIFIAQIALCMLAGTVPLYATLAFEQVLEARELWLSALAFAPSALGLAAGKWLRDRMSQDLFRRILLIALVCLGLALIAKGLG